MTGKASRAKTPGTPDSQGDAARIANPEQEPESELRPHVEIIGNALRYVGVKTDRRSGATAYAPPVWLSDPIEIKGSGCDDQGRQCRILHWKRQGNGQSITVAMPSADIGEREGWASLRAGGLAVTADPHARVHLAHWLQRDGATHWHHIVSMTGWQHGAFVLPSGELIGEPAQRMLFNGAPHNPAAYVPCGTLDDWQAHTGRLARGNPLVIASIACALAGPLLALIDARDGIGLHLYTNSSSGKSTCADAAASVWGHPARTLHTWNGTALGLSLTAEAANDLLLYLDEIGSGEARKIGPAIYQILNGVSRLQGARDGGVIASRQWRLALISTGEIAMGQFLSEGGLAPRGGQEIRLLDVPADVAQYRAFDCIQGYMDGETFATALATAARAHYGTLGRAFVQWLIKNPHAANDAVTAAQTALLDLLPAKAAPTVRRATRKFAVLSAAAALASQAGLTGWSADEAHEGVRITWERWLQAFGTEDRDDKRLIDQADHVLTANQYARFVLREGKYVVNREHDPTREPVAINIMGYKRYDDNSRVTFDGKHPAISSGFLFFGVRAYVSTIRKRTRAHYFPRHSDRAHAAHLQHLV